MVTESLCVPFSEAGLHWNNAQETGMGEMVSPVAWVTVHGEPAVMFCVRDVFVHPCTTMAARFLSS